MAVTTTLIPPVRLITSDVGDYFELLKPRVMSLVLFTSWVGYILAPGYIHPFIACMGILAIALGAGASGALNMWLERDSDALMTRTRTRPLPSGRADPSDALALGMIFAVGSVTLMALAVHVQAALLLAFTILFYVVVYTMALKRTTDQNIVIGGLAGALPPLIGWWFSSPTWAAEPLILVAIIFMWTPPHFWALALLCQRDYAAAGIPMLPVTRGYKSTVTHIMAYAALLFPLTMALSYLHIRGVIYTAGALALNVLFLAYAWKLYRTHELQSNVAKKVFTFSIFYLFALFALMVVDHYFFIPAF